MYRKSDTGNSLYLHENFGFIINAKKNIKLWKPILWEDLCWFNIGVRDTAVATLIVWIKVMKLTSSNGASVMKLNLQGRWGTQSNFSCTMCTFRMCCQSLAVYLAISGVCSHINSIFFSNEFIWNVSMQFWMKLKTQN